MQLLFIHSYTPAYTLFRVQKYWCISDSLILYTSTITYNHFSPPPGYPPLLWEGVGSSEGSGVMGLGSGGRGLAIIPPCFWPGLPLVAFFTDRSSVSLGRLVPILKECSFLPLLLLEEGDSPSSSLSLYSLSRAMRLSRWSSGKMKSPKYNYLHTCM